MVKKLFLVLLFLITALYGESKIDVALDHDGFAEGAPITGSLNITHSQKDIIDLNSFSYQGKPLKVESTKKVRFDSDLVVESLRFSLPPMSPGLQLLDSFKGKVGSESVKSIPTSVQIQKFAPLPVQATSQNRLSNSPMTQSVKAKPFLKLESINSSEGPFYPGQQVTVGYRYSFQGDIDLNKEEVPLLDQIEITKLGEKQIQDTQKGTLSIREITQRLEFINPGTYTIPKSVISGYAYLDRGWGPKTYFEPALSSEIAPITFIVKPFPEQSKPPFFSGALGPFEISRSVSVPPRLQMGDKMTLNLVFSGVNEPLTIKPPNLLCQPGWSGFFSVGDLPPQGESKKNTLNFSYEIRPLNFLVSELPPVFFAYFDPQEEKYHIVKTAPFSYTIKPETRIAGEQSDKENLPNQKIEMKASFQEPALLPEEKEISFELNLFSSPWVLLLLPLSLMGHLLYLFYKDHQAELLRRPKSVDQLLQEAKKELPDKPEFFEKAQEVLVRVYGPGPYSKEVTNFLSELLSARWGKYPPSSLENQYRELERLCMPNGKQKPIAG